MKTKLASLIAVAICQFAISPCIAENASTVKTQCSLDEAQLATRKKELLLVIKAKATSVAEEKAGYKFTLPRDSDTLEKVASLILLETECCPFLAFSVTAPSGKNHIVLEISGPPEAKTFISSIFEIKRGA